MPRISINEIDNTLYSASNTRDNIVFVPGIATKGAYDEPILVTNTQDFIDTFGDKAPDDSITGAATLTSWEYAYNLLSAGFSVLFKRIVAETTDGEQTAKMNIYSEYALSDQGEVTAGTPIANVVIGTVKANYPGTYGNRFSFTIDNTSFKVYIDNKMFESYNFSMNLDKALEVSAEKLTTVFKELNDHKFSDISVSITANKLDKVPTTSTTTASYKQKLTGGIDTTYDRARDILESDSDNTFSTLTDKYIYDVKFITSGGITCEGLSNNTSSGHVEPNKLAIYESILKVAYNRQDCLALFDVPLGASQSHKDELNKVFDTLSNDNNTALSYAAAYAPWGYKLSPVAKTYKWCPPSYIFLITLAESIKNGSFSWQIPAGVNRGSVTNMIDTEYTIGENLLNKWQNDNPASINPIMNLRNYGFTIFGQRTLYSITPTEKNMNSALKEVGVRLVTIDIKKKIFDIAVGLTFEGNNIHTWSEFAGQLTPYLDNIKANRGISAYEIIMDSNTTTIDSINNNTVVGIVRIAPTRAAENFDISFELTQENILVTDSLDNYNVTIANN